MWHEKCPQKKKIESKFSFNHKQMFPPNNAEDNAESEKLAFGIIWVTSNWREGGFVKTFRLLRTF